MAQLSIETGDTECIISNTDISIPQDSSANEINNDSGTRTQFETVWKSDIVSVLLTKTNRQQKNIIQIVKHAVLYNYVVQMDQQKVLSNGDANVT